MFNTQEEKDEAVAAQQKVVDEAVASSETDESNELKEDAIEEAKEKLAEIEAEVVK